MVECFQSYCNSIKYYPVLSKEETLELTKKFFESRDEKLKQKLVNHNLRLVIKLVNKFTIPASTKMDLIQEGNLGLIYGIEKFDPTKNVPLTSYVAFWIRAYILKFLMNSHKLVKVGTSEGERKIFWNLAKQRAKLEAQGIEVNTQNLASVLGVSEEDVIRAQRLNYNDMSLYDEDGKPMEIEDDSSSQDNLFIEHEKNRILNLKLNEFSTKLKPTKQFVLWNRILGELTLDETASEMMKQGVSEHMTRQRVQQIEADLLDVMKKTLRELK